MSNVQVSSGELRASATPVLSAGALRALVAIGLMALGFAVFWPTTASLVVRWQDTVVRAYTHGFFIVAIAAWLLWRARATWAHERANVSILGFALLLAGGVAWLVAYRAGLQIVHQALLPCIIAAAVLTCLGASITRRMSLQLGYLFFAIPVWDAINPLLQWISVVAVRLLLQLVGIPAFFNGHTFQIPAGSFEIADGCSGLHFFIVALAVAVLYGEINRDTRRTRIKLVLLAVALAMATNWIRVLIIVVAGHLTDMQHHLVSEEHYSFGWFLFAGTMLVFFLIVRRWPIEAGQVSGANESVPSRAIPSVGIALAVAGMLPAAASNIFDRNVADAPSEILPVTVNGWTANEFSSGDWRPSFAGADGEEFRSYRLQDAGSDVSLDAYSAIYLEQHQGKEIVSYKNSVIGHEPGVTATRGQPVAQPQWTEVGMTDAAGGQWLVWYAYRIDERWQANALRLQLTFGLRSLTQAPLTSVVALRARCASDCEEARTTLSRFMADAWPNS